MISPQHHIFGGSPGLWEALIAIMFSIMAFADHSLPIIRWLAAFVGIIAGIASVLSVIRHWNDKV